MSAEAVAPNATRNTPDRVTAVCCSGGGIRSASFNLGALQELAARGVLTDVDYLLAVSGGSYIAASHALVAARSPAQPSPDDVYARGSPEEAHLRNNSRYLLPNAAVALRGAVRLLLGMAFNLVLVLAWVFVAGHVLGWLLEWRGLLTGLRSGDPGSFVKWAWVVPAALGAGAVLLAFGGRRRWQTASWAAMVLALVAAIALLGAPRAVRGLYDVGLHDGGNAGTVVRGLGFATPGGCAAARISERDKSNAICGVTTGRKETNKQAATEARGEVPKDARGQGGGFLAFVLALGGLVRAALGRLRGQRPSADGTDATAQGEAADAPTRPSWVRRVGAMIQRAVLPWLGTVFVLGVLLLLWLRWTADGASQGFTAAELAKVAIAVGVLAAGRIAIDINRTSMHGFYRDRLATAYSVVRASNRTTAPEPAARISELRSATAGGSRPELVVCAAANVNEIGQVPPGRGAMSFTFTPETFGLSAAVPAGTRPGAASVLGRHDVRASSEAYEKVVGANSSTLYDAVAISGAAISPLMGKMTRPAQRFLFAIADIRLGTWLPHPSYVDLAAAHPPSSWKQLPLSDRIWCWALRRRLEPTDSTLRRWVSRVVWRAMQPNLRLLLAEAFGQNKAGAWWLYVTDGGHYDNLALVEALRRGATDVYVFDASGDTVTTWSTLGQAIALARSELGAEIDIEPEEMVEDGKVVRPWVTGSFTYTWDARQPPREGRIHVCKLGVWPGAPWDVQAYAVRHPTFPTDSTVQQLYDDEEFEAYRALGQAATKEMLDAQPRQQVAT